MFRTFCKSKITGAFVTQSLRQYEGSCGVDEAILAAADIRPYEWILIANVTSGARLETYAIPEPRGSGAIHIYGAAAHRAGVGDELIIMSVCRLDDEEAERYLGPRVVKLGTGNRLGA
jgi:aspartate 1-decarboxylase